MAPVELGNIWTPPLTIPAKFLDLNICAVEIYIRLPACREVMYSLEDLVKVSPKTQVLDEKRAIIHKLSNTRADNRMRRDIPEDFQIMLPAGYIDPIEQRACS